MSARRKPRRTAPKAPSLDLERIRAQLEAQNEDLREAQRLLEESRDRYAALYDFAPLGYVTLNRSGLIRQINLACARLLEVEITPLLGTTFGAFVHSEDVIKFHAFLRAAALHTTLTTTEIHILNRSGREWFAELIGQPMHDPDSDSVVLWVAVLDISDRKTTEAALQTSHGALQLSHERLQSLSRQLLAAQETERRTIARALHDEIGQTLSAIKLDLQAVRDEPPSDRVPTLIESIQSIDWALQTVRTLSLDLHPVLLDDLGLPAALRWYADRQGQRGGFSVDVQPNTLTPRPRPEVEIICFRVAQEALTNIMRHAAAQHVRLELHLSDHELGLIIADDGRGFDVTAARARTGQGHSLGLINMEERVALGGGRLTIESAIGRGTTIRVWLPLDPNSHRRAFDQRTVGDSTP